MQCAVTERSLTGAEPEPRQCASSFVHEVALFVTKVNCMRQVFVRVSGFYETVEWNGGMVEWRDVMISV